MHINTGDQPDSIVRLKTGMVTPDEMLYNIYIIYK